MPDASGKTQTLQVLTRPGQGLGFRLAGAPVIEVPVGSEERVVAEVLARPDLGVLAVEEEVWNALPEPVSRRVRQRGVPAILPFALPRRWSETTRGQDYVAAMIRRAVGYHVKIAEEGWP